MNYIDVKRAFNSIKDQMVENKDYLIKLDQKNGDGDLGLSMESGFKAVCQFMEDNEIADLGMLFMKSASVFNETAPSSLGTILSFGFMGMAKSLKGIEDASLEEIVQALEQGLNKIMEKAGSKPGEKTILDSLAPAIESLKTGLEAGKKAAFEEAYNKASEGSENTKNMMAVHGRAAYYREESLGVLDGGSVVGKLIFKGIYESIA